MGKQLAVVPEIHVITVGEEPKIKAYILQGSVTCCEKFVDADPAATTTEALKKLLVLTQQMLDFHIDDIGNHSFNFPTKHLVGKPDDKDLDLDSDKVSNGAMGFNFDGRSSSVTSDNSFDSAIGGCGGYDFVAPTLVLPTEFSEADTLYDARSGFYNLVNGAFSSY